jgi:hypothetical protein
MPGFQLGRLRNALAVESKELGQCPDSSHLSWLDRNSGIAHIPPFGRSRIPVGKTPQCLSCRVKGIGAMPGFQSPILIGSKLGHCPHSTIWTKSVELELVGVHHSNQENFGPSFCRVKLVAHAIPRQAGPSVQLRSTQYCASKEPRC